MPVNADTIESPVTTVYSTAPKAAAAMVPIAYSALVDYIHVHPSQADTRSYRRPTVAGH